MSIRKLNEEGVVSGWNNKMPFPKDRYTLRCIEEAFAPSKSSRNPMITRTWEICCPEPIVIGDKKVDVDGKTITQMCITKVHVEGSETEWDQEKSDKAFSRFRDEIIALGYEGEDIDDENPPLIADGKVVDAIVYGRKDVARKSPTSEQLRKGIKQGDPIKDANGKDVVVYTLCIETILGLSTVEVNRPY